MHQKSVFKTGSARVLVRSKLQEFPELPEEAFEADLSETWKQCLSRQGISVSEFRHSLKTKKTKCQVNDTVGDLTKFYKREVVLRIWICNFSKLSSNFVTPAQQSGQSFIDDRYLLSEDSGGELEDSQDEGEMDDDQEIFYREKVNLTGRKFSVPVTEQKAPAVVVKRNEIERGPDEVVIPRRGRGRPRKIPARFVSTPSPARLESKKTVSLNQTYPSTTRTRRLRSSAEPLVQIKQKSYKQSSKLPNFESRVALAQKKKNDELLAKLPPHVKRVPIKFHSVAESSGKKQLLPYEPPRSGGNEEQSSSKKVLIVTNGQRVVDSNANRDFAGGRLPLESETSGEVSKKIVYHNSGRLKRHSDMVNLSGQKRYAASASATSNTPLAVGSVQNGDGDRWWSPETLDTMSQSSSRGEDQKAAFSIIPNSKKWGPGVHSGPNVLQRLFRDRVETAVHDNGLPILTPNLVSHSSESSSLINTSASTNGASLNGGLPTDDFTPEMPKLEVQVPLSDDEEDHFIPTNTSAKSRDGSSSIPDTRQRTTFSVVLPGASTAIPTQPLGSREETSLPTNFPEVRVKISKSPVPVPPPVAAKVRIQKPQRAATAKPRRIVKEKLIKNPEVATPKAAAVPPPPPVVDTNPEDYWSQDDENEEDDLERDDIKFRKAVLRYWKSLKPDEFRTMQKEMRVLRSDSTREYGVCKEMPYTYTALTTAMKLNSCSD